MSVSVWSVASSCTPVMTGVTSSRDAEMATCEIASAKALPSTTPVRPSTVGTVGYSSSGILASENCALPQRTVTLVPSSSTRTSRCGSFAAMSLSSRPETSTTPSPSTSADTVVRAEDSKSKDEKTTPSEVDSMRTPLRIGIVGRCGSSFTANDTASLKTSRLMTNFTGSPPWAPAALRDGPSCRERTALSILAQARDRGSCRLQAPAAHGWRLAGSSSHEPCHS